MDTPNECDELEGDQNRDCRMEILSAVEQGIWSIEKEKQEFEESLRDLQQRCADADDLLMQKTEAIQEMDKHMDAKRLGH